MTTAEEDIARLVGHPLPAVVVATLASYPAELVALAKNDGFAPRECWLYPDLGTLVAQNEEVRAEDIWTEEGPWPADHLDIGADIGGDRFALVLAGDNAGAVLRLDTDVGRFEPCAPSFDAYVAALLRVARGERKSLDDALR